LFSKLEKLKIIYMDMDTPQRSKKADCKRRIKEKIYNLLDNKYEEIIMSQQKDFNHDRFKPLLTKFFHKNTNINELINDLNDLQIEYSQFDSDTPFKELVQQILYSIEISKIGSQLDKKVNEYLKTYIDFIK
jgi:hypothetical protein